MVHSIPKFHVPVDITEARAIQTSLCQRVKLTDNFAPILSIAGVDVGYDNARGLAHASVVVLKFGDLSVVEQIQAFAPADFPYVPGFLSFREIPAILAALGSLNTWPQLFMVDGQGIAHPKRLGIAAHLGVLLDMPTIGVAKSRLVGSFNKVGSDKGDQVPLMDGNERIGTVLRSRDHVAPLFISPGHRVSMDTATSLTMRCLTRYRLPEPTRLADKFSKCKTNPSFTPVASDQLAFDVVS